MAATGSSARSTLLVQISPSRKAKLSFTVQLVLILFWLTWAVLLLVNQAPSNDQNYLYYIFFGLALAFLIYVILQNTSIFGIQSYIEVTPQYIVQKQGVFRAKRITSIPDIETMHISRLALRIVEHSGNKIFLDLKQVRKKRDLERLKNKIRELAETHNFQVTETSGQ
ncbi:hypothetical protein ACFSKU_11075 [Pontibacter silvestris]|uniref:DUF304 domain-containing protein n=1 Tax=Pontibacter silvestris TaxID=2305183 RepID=A0ABW4WYU7_9BACT|nr:hypothetical protein [Pontibacter silvestris]MCC9138727.1 hypothetical protein [Pontibacter silvestris]